MAKNIVQIYRAKQRKKRPGVHSKNASKAQNKYKKKYKGQGKQR
jgi:hypothetical protein